MKLTLEIDTENNRLQALCALNADAVAACVHDAEVELRNIVKHEEGIPEMVHSRIDGIRSLLREALTLLRYE